ncbi:M20/M25/M40 family metallo-hydrolase [Trebonia kvetii]|uniref:M20/M25/M40 family metallo-hydrolase n=1 Tax=Trebonia kvetii TaxID=2480626 RepID=A0A6P2BLZ2_9ACTN|nr:M20/M25/M40 family metallo-hydrolase [Trebonia kvetii]TVZ00034.1 M20/M25/M40 family metallo-hydrolase [Trebonia kvetii]
MTENQVNQVSSAEEEVAAICRDLIRIDTTNPGNHSGPGERRAAEYVAGLLSEVGLAPEVLESHPKRTSLVARIEGEDRTRPGLLIHGHLDVVPADAKDWRQHPFSGEIADGCVWGRGAVDMKDMDAIMLAVARQRLREGRKPKRDVVLAFTADEEAGGTWGAQFLVEQHPDLFEGVTEAIGEVGGFSVSVGDQRLYAVQTAEKGIAWMRLKATGTAGHGSMIHNDNAVTKLSEALARVGRHQWPTQLPDATSQFLTRAAQALGVEFDPQDPASVIGKLGGMSKMIGATTQHTANPTGFKAGYKVNVIPQTATAELDGRFLPGREEEFFAELDRLLGTAVSREFIHHDVAVETTADGDLWNAMKSSLNAEDPEGIVTPYCLSAGTDAKWFSKIGIRCFGFSPLRLPAELDFPGMFHGVDERVPLDSLRFGVRVVDRLLDIC